MADGTMLVDGFYPSANGIQLDGVPLLAGYNFNQHLAALTIEGTPGVGSSYFLEARIKDGNIDQWVQIPDSEIEPSITGHVVVKAIGTAVRLNATNGGVATAKYILNIYKDTRAHYEDFYNV
jgi:hypothetical protein